MNSLISTIIGVCVIETAFFIFAHIVKKKKSFSVFVATFVLGLIVMFFSFGNAVSAIFKHMAISGDSFSLMDIALIFFNMFYGYIRGLKRIAEINKKHSNL